MMDFQSLQLLVYFKVMCFDYYILQIKMHLKQMEVEH